MEPHPSTTAPGLRLLGRDVQRIRAGPEDFHGWAGVPVMESAEPHSIHQEIKCPSRHWPPEALDGPPREARAATCDAFWLVVGHFEPCSAPVRGALASRIRFAERPRPKYLSIPSAPSPRGTAPASGRPGGHGMSRMRSSSSHNQIMYFYLRTICGVWPRRTFVSAPTTPSIAIYSRRC